MKWSDEGNKILLESVLEYQTLQHGFGLEWESSLTKSQDIHALFLERCTQFLELNPTLKENYIGHTTQDENGVEPLPCEDYIPFHCLPTKDCLMNKIYGLKHQFRRKTNTKSNPSTKSNRFSHKPSSAVYKFHDYCVQLWGDDNDTTRDSDQGNEEMKFIVPLEVSTLSTPSGVYTGGSDSPSGLYTGGLYTGGSASPPISKQSSVVFNPCQAAEGDFFSTRKRPHSNIISSDVEDSPAETIQTNGLQLLVKDHSLKIRHISSTLENLTKAVAEGFQNMSKQFAQGSPAPQLNVAPTLQQCPWGETTNTRTLVVRLLPGMPLKQSLLDFCKNHGVAAASISTCVGSLTKATLRLADGDTMRKCQGPFEIVSLVGVIANSHAHLHISLGDIKGQVVGGHLVNDDIVHTTAELVITELGGLTLRRDPCKLSGWPELNICKASSQSGR